MPSSWTLNKRGYGTDGAAYERRGHGCGTSGLPRYSTCDCPAKSGGGTLRYCTRS